MTEELPKIRPAHGSMLAENALGRTVSLAGGRQPWRHPWFTSAQWDGPGKIWYAIVLAGFVNGAAPMAQTRAGLVRDAGGAFWGKFVDAQTGAAEIAQLANLASGSSLPDDTRLNVPIYQNAPVPLTAWRAIGWDGDGTEAVPAFFADRGVSKPPPGPSVDTDTGVVSSSAPAAPPAGNRLLRAIDLILHQPRAALTSQIDFEGVLSGEVTQTLGQRAPEQGDFLKILAGDFARSSQNLTADPWTAANALANKFEEAQYDEILISTVYLLSPPNTASGSDPDASWQPFAAHKLFWNLHWQQPKLQQVAQGLTINDALAGVKYLGGGAGAVAISYEANSIDEGVNSVLNLMNGTSLAGTFWTPTGGGTTSANPYPVQIALIKQGLNKAATNAAKAAAAAAIRRTRQLDPNFPFEGRAFNLSLLN